MTVCLIKSLQKLPYMHCIDMSLANPRYTLYSHSHVLRHGRVRYTVTQFEFTCTEAPSSWSFMLQNCRKRSGCICNAVYASYKNYQYAELGNICRASLPHCHTTPLILYTLVCHTDTLHLWFSTLSSATLPHYTSDSLHSSLPHWHTTPLILYTLLCHTATLQTVNVRRIWPYVWNFPAENTVHTPYIRMYVWYWSTLHIWAS